jgi:hypothetical protein
MATGAHRACELRLATCGVQYDHSELSKPNLLDSPWGDFMRAAKLCLLLLVCEGGHLAAQGAVNPNASALNGSWHVFGKIVPKSAGLSVSIYADGNRLYGIGDFQVLCADGASVIGGVLVEGSASDGKFVLESPKVIDDQSHSTTETKVVIEGKIPAPGGSKWAGHYSIARVGPDGQDTNCPALSERFVAERYAPPNGVYSGKITGTGFGSGTVVALRLRQSSDLCFPNMGTDTGTQKVCQSSYQGSFTIKGPTSISPKPVTLHTIKTEHSPQQGDAFSLSFPLSDGSELGVGCRLGDPGSHTITAFVIHTDHGVMDKSLSGQGKLTRR